MELETIKELPNAVHVRGGGRGYRQDYLIMDFDLYERTKQEYFMGMVDSDYRVATLLTDFDLSGLEVSLPVNVVSDSWVCLKTYYYVAAQVMQSLGQFTVGTGVPYLPQVSATRMPYGCVFDLPEGRSGKAAFIPYERIQKWHRHGAVFAVKFFHNDRSVYNTLVREEPAISCRYSPDSHKCVWIPETSRALEMAQMHEAAELYCDYVRRLNSDSPA